MEEQQGRIRFIDLFSGLGGTRLGLEQACQELGLECECILSSDKKKSAAKAYKHNFDEDVFPDVTKIDESELGDFDFLLAGFPCQPFSRAGMKRGFADTRGTMFFEIERILKAKKPKFFLLENVAELTTNDHGRTLEVIMDHLDALGYATSWAVLDGHDFGLAQNRRRIYIAGICGKDPLDFDDLDRCEGTTMKDVMEHGLPLLDTPFTKAVLSTYKPKDLRGYVISDKRRGPKTMHSWDIGSHGKVSEDERELMEAILSNFRKRKWADQLGVTWRDGMPLNLDQICEITGWDKTKAAKNLDSLTEKGYLMKRHPYKDGSLEERTDLPIGWKLVTSRVSFELNRFLGEDDVCVTLTATDASHIGIIDGKGLRRLSTRECLRLFGFPETYDLSCVKQNEAYDLVGNSICVPVVKAIAKKMLEQ
jgi:DNA (cytosine-5)-methyltransferase 1